jgi:putative endonuclease
LLAHHALSKQAFVYGRRARRRDMPVRSEETMWYVYIVSCNDGSLYTGSTTDIDRRIKEHNNKKGGSYTRIRTPVKLKYQEEHYDRISAQKREAQIKQWRRAMKLALISQDKSTLRKLSVSRD